MHECKLTSLKTSLDTPFWSHALPWVFKSLSSSLTRYIGNLIPTWSRAFFKLLVAMESPFSAICKISKKIKLWQVDLTMSFCRNLSQCHLVFLRCTCVVRTIVGRKCTPFDKSQHSYAIKISEMWLVKRCVGGQIIRRTSVRRCDAIPNSIEKN